MREEFEVSRAEDENLPDESRSETPPKAHVSLGAQSAFEAVQSALVAHVSLVPGLDDVDWVSEQPREASSRPARHHEIEHAQVIPGPTSTVLVAQELEAEKVDGDGGNVPSYGQTSAPHDPFVLEKAESAGVC